MTKTIILFSILFFSTSAFAELKVVTSTTDLAAIAKAVGGKNVTVQSLSSYQEDPHFVDARPDKILLLNKADLLIKIGLGLESGWLPALQKQARNPKILSGSGVLVASSHIALLEITNGDRASGDIHPGGNPHFTFDPRQGIRIANAIQKRLAELDPSHLSLYKKNTKELVSQLNSISKKQHQRFLALPANTRNVVTYHRSLPYLMDWLALTTIAELEPKPGVPPNPKHMAKVMKMMKRNHVKAILQESFYPHKTSKTLAKIVKAKVVSLAGGTRYPQQTYVQHVTSISDQIYKAILK